MRKNLGMGLQLLLVELLVAMLAKLSELRHGALAAAAAEVPLLQQVVLVVVVAHLLVLLLLIICQIMLF